MALRHAGQNADQEAQARDDDGSGQRSGLEAFDDLTQNARDVKQLDEEENAGDVAQQLPFDGADEDILDWNGAVGAHQHEDHGGGHHAHGDGCTDAAENHQKEDGRHGQNRKPEVHAVACEIKVRVFTHVLGAQVFELHRTHEHQPADGKHQSRHPNKVNNHVAHTHAHDRAGKNHARNDGT